ncbi:PLP-dependent aminotransferase family protein [Burkholderia multivorans]|uniref:MocR-like pyridoxine biosynthesis transcription factor PdxR n=1 Tax=Burkholderia multivorans TaxID=87883 RepID=UPI001C23BE4D|nr:PLP-dependent aminotransferase family protein [Burkholderia multivorans]MBU9206765.1 PLP-dependent aminotransferase family protein [Burkholderia multivorans]MBU9581453.1 PLP-dependent aminotransferase family protein [Burkholderia multivorans]MCO1463678.1 PLP-dependent aminotransferase family protein [Burkholderia multivorans]
MTTLSIGLDRSGRTSLSAQIYGSIRDAIESGKLASGARLPSWSDLAAQLGVSRGTVRAAYERLIDEQFAIGLGAAGTRVAERPAVPVAAGWSPEAPPLPDLFAGFGNAPLPFQMGVPSQAAFPFKLWSRVQARAARRASAAPVGYPDPRGDPDLRREIAAYLAVARGLRCSPSQVFITAGFSGALGLAIRGLGLEGRHAWIEDPGFPLTRTALGLAGMTVTAVPVDADGLDVDAGIRDTNDAALAVVTPGQQAPLGVTMSLARRIALLAWARQNDAWIVEDDYLSELQLTGRAAPALASLDQDGRVLHIGSFSKTLSPALRLGFLVVPPDIARRFGDVAACLAPAPAACAQHAVTEFIQDGHYLRHLRRMKRLYAAHREALLRCLNEQRSTAIAVQATAGMAVVTALPADVSDVDIAMRARACGLSPVPLSPWYMGAARQQGLLLGVTNLNHSTLADDCRRLLALVREHR